MGKPRGRPFQPGHPGHPRAGRPLGAKDKLPRGRSGVREMLANIIARSGSLIEAGLEQRMKKGDFRLIDLMAAYLDGKPVQRVQVETPQPLTIQITMPDGSTRTVGPGLK